MFDYEFYDVEDNNGNNITRRDNKFIEGGNRFNLMKFFVRSVPRCAMQKR